MTSRTWATSEKSTRLQENLTKICKTCNGPLLGHIDTEEDCAKKTRASKLKDAEAKILMDYFRNLTCFKYKMLMLDTRTSQTHCDECGENMASRMDLMMHMESTHKVRIGDQRVNESTDSCSPISDLASVMMQNSRLDQKAVAAEQQGTRETQ